MSSHKYILVAVLSQQCGHCVNFKANHGDALQELINKRSDLKLVMIDTPTLSSGIPSKYPKSLKNYVSWYPSFVLFPKDNWSKSIVSDIPLSGGAVFNGKIDKNGKLEYESSGKQLNPESIIQWIDSQIKSGKVLPLKAKYEFNNSQNEYLVPTTNLYYKNNN
jgi:hypothetical protein